MSNLLDPVAAYDRLAGHFSDLSARRRKYLETIEDLVVSQISHGSKSLLDIGSGDGARAMRIAHRAGLCKMILLEPSLALRTRIQAKAEIWPIRAEEIETYPSAQNRRFDVIICLWNVLGHLRNHAVRGQLLHQIRERLSPQGRFFIDVTHRYNIRSYGVTKTALRYLYDQVNPEETNGDVAVKWNLGVASCSTFGHVFTHREMLELAKHAGLQIEGRVAVDYETGQTRRFDFQGNLFYKFRRSSVSDFSSAVTTSSTLASVI